nr:RNA polymerase sigma factor [Ktedonosporobacter rubrisoli]
MAQNLQDDQEQLPSFEVLYERYYIRVYRYLRTHVQHDEDAADLAQHVFLQVWKQRHSYRPGRGSLATWLFSIAHNRLVDFYRTARPAVSWEAVPEISVVEQDPEAIAISAETLAQVKKLLEELPQIERELLSLRFAARLSSAEIAQVIGKSEAATRKQLTRLIHRLRERYKRLSFEELLDLLEMEQSEFTAILERAYRITLPGDLLQRVQQNLLQRIETAL